MRLFLFGSLALALCSISNAQSAIKQQQPSTAVLSRADRLPRETAPGLPEAPSAGLGTSAAGSPQNMTLASVDLLQTAIEPGGKPAEGQTNKANPAAGAAQINGVVSDTQGNGIPEAEITLISPGKQGHARKMAAAADGSFTFNELPAGEYRLVITATGFATYTSSEFLVKSGETVEAPRITLNVVTVSSVTVHASADEIAEAQVEEQEKQRVFGIFQNFYTSYIWEADAMSPRQKYKLAFRTIIDPTAFLTLAGVAGAEQYNNTYPGYGPGPEGYAKRYGAALAESVSGRMIGSAILASLFHQDPRYFYQGSGGVRSRTWHALSSAFITRGDNGKLQPNYSHLLGNLIAGGIANAYHPESSRGIGLTFQTFGISTGANAVGNIFREFALRDLEPSVPGFANGKKVPAATSKH